MAEPARRVASDAPTPKPAAAARPFAPGVGRAALVAAALLGLFFSPALSPARQFGSFDTGRLHVPAKRYLAEELRAGHVPQWNPYAGLGTPELAGGVDGVLHPFNAVLVALPFDLGLKLWVLLCYGFAATGAFAWARRLGLGFGPALLAGVAFALSGYTVSESGNIQYLAAMAFFPWVLAAGNAFVERPSAARGALVAAASFACAASGDPQGWAIALGIVPLGALVAPPREGRRRGAVRATAAVALAVAGAAPVVLPVLAWIPHSSRGEALDAWDYQAFNLLPRRALELVIPHLVRTEGHPVLSPLYQAHAGSAVTSIPWAPSVYAGSTVVALALLGARRSAAARLLVAAAALFTWAAMGHYAGFGALARALPVLSSIRYWEKLCAWPALFLAVAAAFGLAALEERRSSRRFGDALLLVAGALAAAAGVVALAPAQVSAALVPSASLAVRAVAVANLRDGLLHSAAFTVALGFAARLAGGGRLRHVALTASLLCALDLAAANVRAYVLFPREVNEPPTALGDYLHAKPGLQRLLTPFQPFHGALVAETEMEDAWRFGAEGLYASWNLRWRVANFENYAGMRPVRSNRVIRRTQAATRLPAYGLWGFEWLWVPSAVEREATPLLPSRRAPAPDAPPLPGVLYRIASRPRVYLAGPLSSVDRRAAMDFVLDPASAEGERSVLEAPVPTGYSPPSGAARLTEDAPERLRIETSADRPALLVVNDEYTVGWSAAVDGRPAEILPVNYLARGVWVGAGDHEVTLRYRTPWLREGALLAAAVALGLGAWAAALRSRRRGEAAT